MGLGGLWPFVARLYNADNLLSHEIVIGFLSGGTRSRGTARRRTKLLPNNYPVKRGGKGKP